MNDNMPLMDHQSHRLAFIKFDQKRFDSKKVLILPYLHERKIYFKKEKAGCDYFYTTISSYDDLIGGSQYD